MDRTALRERTWDRLDTEGLAAFPFPPHGRIPNFVGANSCVPRLQRLDVWRNANRVKANPDAPQRMVRQRALEEGKVVFMAVPRLTDEACFVRLDPGRLAVDARAASSIKGAFRHGEQVAPEELKRIDLIVAGSVAVDVHGGRVGKGGGYSDLEFAIAREFGAVGEDTPVVTTVHDVQIVEEPIPMRPHDVPLDVVVTPTRVIRTGRDHPKPPGVLWDLLPTDKLGAMPVLERLQADRGP